MKLAVHFNEGINFQPYEVELVTQMFLASSW